MQWLQVPNHSYVDN